jgi:GntR family transcriptional regulator, trigonelline degradation regulator
MTADVGDLRVGRDALTLRELTTGKLRDAILSLRFKPGEHLVERVLCEQTGVSRSCLREALQHLESEGLIERRGGRGVFVASITVEEARQIYEVRAALEPEIGRLFSERATEDHINELFDSVAALSAAMAAHDIQGYVKALDRFYETLCAGSGNLVARRILHTLQGRMSYLRAVTTAKASQSRERETVQLMQEMAEAARRRDPVEVAHRCRAFVDRSAAFAIRVLSEKAVPENSSP